MLTEQGQRQATNTGEQLSTRLTGPSYIYSSNMTRARQMTEHLLTSFTNRYVNVQYDNKLTEVGFHRRTIYRDEESQFLVSILIIFN